MVLPESNLPPDAQKWRRAIENAIAQLQKQAGITSTNLKATRSSVAGVSNTSQRIEEEIQGVKEDVTDVINEVDAKDQSAWTPKPPKDPKHNQHWFDVTDGNVMRVWVDYGDAERVNFIRNPSFTSGTEGWAVSRGSLSTTEGQDPVGRIDVENENPNSPVALISYSIVDAYEDMPPTEDTGEGDEGSGEAGQAGVPWSAGIDIRVDSGNPDVIATLEVHRTGAGVVSSSGPIDLTGSTETTRLVASSIVEENLLGASQVVLSITGLTTGDIVYVDKAMMEAVAEPVGDYFDADMPGIVEETRFGVPAAVWDGNPRWTELQDEKAIRESLAAASESLASATALIDALRERVGNKRFVGESFEETHFKWTPLGGGQIRFEATVEQDEYSWENAGGTMLPATGEGRVWETTAPGPGTYEIILHPDEHIAFVTVTEEMMDEDYGWEDINYDVALDELTAPGGPLDPAVIYALWEEVVVGGFLVATEKIIGPEVIATKAVTAPAMNVVTELPNGAKMSLLEDGIRLWNPGNDGPWPNVVMTTVDGFAIGNDNGERLMWIDPDTGDLRTAGAVVSGGEIIGSSFQGGSIDITSPTGVPILQADETGGVRIGGEVGIYQRASYNAPGGGTAETTHVLTDYYDVDPHSWYKVSWNMEKDSISPSHVMVQVFAEYPEATTPSQREIAVMPYKELLNDPNTGLVYSYRTAAPAGASRGRLVAKISSTDTRPITRFRGISVREVGEGSIDLAGSIRGDSGYFGHAEITGNLYAGAVNVFSDPSERDIVWFTRPRTGAESWTTTGGLKRWVYDGNEWVLIWSRPTSETIGGMNGFYGDYERYASKNAEGLVVFEGYLERTGNNLTVSSSWVQFGTVPAGYRPRNNIYVAGSGTSRQALALQISTGGSLYLRALGDSGSTVITTGTRISLAQFPPYYAAD